MIPSQFEYHAPTTLAGVIALLQSSGDNAKIIAGGHSLLPMMKLRFAAPDHIIDIQKVAELKGIAQVGGEIHIGPLTTENDIIFSALLKEKLPLLIEVAHLIADPQVRYKGTIGGDIAHGDPGNDHPAVMMALGASFDLTGPGGTRTVAATDFFISTYMTAMEPHEVLSKIRIPLPTAGSGYAYAKLKRKVGDYATAAACVILSKSHGVCDRATITLTNVGPTAINATAAAAALVGTSVDAAAVHKAAQLAMDASDPSEDLRGSVDYKRAMTGQMVERAIASALSRCA